MVNCNISNSNNVRNLMFQCPVSILDNCEVNVNNRLTVSDVSYLVLPVDSNNYTRTTIGNKPSFVDTRTKPFITPQVVRVGFTALIENNLYSIKKALSNLAINSISTSYFTYIPVTCLDYVRPEATDLNYTIRYGKLSVDDGTGTGGSGVNERPLYTEFFNISFEEVRKRLVI